MNSSWQECLGASGARIDQEQLSAQVKDFGDPAAELLAAREATVVCPLTQLGLLECTGEEASTYLHNQLSSDVNHLAPDSAQHAAWCSAKGRMLASFLLYRTTSGFRALLSADLLAATQKRLQMFVLRAKVKLSDLSADTVRLGLSGPQAERILHDAGLSVPENPLETRSSAGAVAIRLAPQRFIIVADSAQAIALWPQLTSAARPVGTAVWDWLEVQAGIVRICAATTEEFVPQMANFDKIGGVSFHKGCYPGQEIVARAQYLGKIKRHLYRFQATTAISPGMPIYAQDNAEHPCGLVANAGPSPAGGFEALAVIQEEFVAGGVELGRPGVPCRGVELVTV
jgi:folate-binding protein YgfZ